MAGLAHGGDDDSVVLVVGQLICYIGEHCVKGGNASQDTVHAVAIFCQNVVCDNQTIAAPLLAEDAGNEAVVGAGPGRAPAGVGRHHAVAASVLDGSLEGLQVNLSGRLLIDPYAQADAVLLTVVEGEVLHYNVHALGLDCGHLVGAHLAGEEAVLGVVLEVAAAVGGAVNIIARAVENSYLSGNAVVADDIADSGHQLGVEGGGHHILRGEGGGVHLVGIGAEEGSRQTLGAVLVTGTGRLNGKDWHSPVKGVADEAHHLVEGQLVEQVIPEGIVVVQADHVVESHAIVGAEGGHVHVLVVVGGVEHQLQVLDESLRQGDGHACGPGASPVAAGEVGDRLLNAVVEVDISV